MIKGKREGGGGEEERTWDGNKGTAKLAEKKRTKQGRQARR